MIGQKLSVIAFLLFLPSYPLEVDSWDQFPKSHLTCNLQMSAARWHESELADVILKEAR